MIVCQLSCNEILIVLNVEGIGINQQTSLTKDRSTVHLKRPTVKIAQNGSEFFLHSGASQGQKKQLKIGATHANTVANSIPRILRINVAQVWKRWKKCTLHWRLVLIANLKLIWLNCIVSKIRTDFWFNQKPWFSGPDIRDPPQRSVNRQDKDGPDPEEDAKPQIRDGWNAGGDRKSGDNCKVRWTLMGCATLKVGRVKNGCVLL